MIYGRNVMKKKNIIIILLSILVVLVLILFGYEKNKTKDTKKQTNIESNKTGTNPDESDITEEDFNTFSNFNNKLVEIEDTKESSDTSAADIKKLTKAWKDAYSNYVKEHGNLTDSFGNSFDIYTLIDINNDTIPELYGNLGSTANGDFVATYSKENGFVVQILWNYGFSYIPNKNLFHDAYGHMDHYEDRIYSIENGQIVLKHNGFYGSEEIYPQIDANGMPIYNYNWDGQNVSYEEYTQKLNAVYNTDESITPFDGAEYVDSRYVGNGLCNYQEILDAIENY